MKHSKLFSLVQHLPEKETALLAKNIKTHKRDTMQKLFAALVKSKKEDEPRPEDVFKTVFGKKYAKSSDYLLRNEYRLLYDWLQEQMLSNLSADTKTDVALFLHDLLRLKAFELFEEEYHTAWKKAIQQDDIDLLVRLSDLNLTYYLTAKPQSLTHAELMAELSQQRLGLLQTQFLRSIRKEEIRLKLSERIISAYKQLPDSSAALENVSLAELEKTDLYAQYLSQRAKINFARGDEKIGLLQAILANEPIVRKYEPAPEEALCRFLINLAQEYYLLMHFKESVSYYQKAYTYFNQVSRSGTRDAYFELHHVPYASGRF
ncbi:MAG: hypothetical protein IPN22_05415 [Bacteroidetes bacterium]|nr:hypothetical protein [Bacteroidota bacterium]